MKDVVGIPLVALSFTPLDYINMIAGVLAIVWYGYLLCDRIKYGPKNKR